MSNYTFPDNKSIEWLLASDRNALDNNGNSEVIRLLLTKIIAMDADIQELTRRNKELWDKAYPGISLPVPDAFS